MSAEANAMISPVLRYDDAPAALDWLTRVLRFEKHTDYRTPDGAVAHADLRFGASAIAVSSATASKPDSPWAAVRHGMYLRVADPDAVHARAAGAGAEIVIPLTDMEYGSREFSLRDPGGHLWAIGTYDTGAQSGEPSLWPEALYRDVSAAAEWLQRALGFRHTFSAPGPDGSIAHAELRLGTAVFMLAQQPASGQGNDTGQFVSLRSDEADALFGKAKAAGAGVVREPHETPYGARACGVRDPGGFLWWISNYAPHD